jgi:hypothetical protein
MWEAKKDLVLEVAWGQRWARVTAGGALWEAKKDLVLEVAWAQRGAQVTAAVRVLHLAWLSR